ncbi:MAG: hypothetical protein F6K24_42725 [Okeania sp. SIO2D1]|nr:hypothetical protein [Okeania sp. SIO2D1]
MNADLMFCVSKMTEDDESYLEYFQDCNIVDVCIYEDSKYGYESLCEEFSKKLNLGDEWRQYLDIKGNWLGGMQGRKGSGMHLNYNYWKLLERLEYLKTKGFNYQRYVITRIDLFWMVQHPPLNLLDPRFIWIPTGEDWYGYNDRHAVCSETNIRYYLNLFELMMNSKARNYLNTESNAKFGLNHEKQLKSHLDYCGVGVGRFNNVAYLTANQNTLTNWGAIQNKLIDGKKYTYKNENELTSALKNAKDFETHKNWNKMIFKVSLIRESIRLFLAKIRYQNQWLYQILRSLKKEN